MQYYAEMASKRRDVDRDAKNRQLHRNASGRAGRIIEFSDQTFRSSSDSNSDPRSQVFDVLRLKRKIDCKCKLSDSWTYTFTTTNENDKEVCIVATCSACDQSIEMKTTRDELQALIANQHED